MRAATRTLAKPATASTVTPPRGFRLLDTMLLVAAVALGCAIISGVYRSSKRLPSEDLHDVFFDWSADSLSAYGAKPLILATFCTPIATMTSLALIPIFLRRPRPRWRRLARQPGLIAAFASALALAPIVLPVVVASLVAWVLPSGAILFDELDWWSLTVFGGTAVLASWATLLAGRHWRAEPSGADRLGRVLGAFWIITGLAVGAGWFLWTFGSYPFVVRPIRTMTVIVAEKILGLAELATPPLALATLAVIPIRLLGPRPRWRRLAHQPGPVAAGAATLTIVLAGFSKVAFVKFLLVEPGGASWKDTLESAFAGDNATFMLRLGGLAVTAAWMTLVAGRRWRPEPSWADRLGRAVGTCWIIAGLAVTISEALL